MQSSLRTGPLLRFREPGQRFIEDVPATFWQGVGAAAEESFMGSLGPLTFRTGRRLFMDGGAMLSPEQANERYAIGDLKFDSPVSEEEALDLYETQKAMLRRQDIVRRSQIGLLPQFLAGLGGAALDPLNIALGLLPEVILARAGWGAKGSGAFARGASPGRRLAYGAAEGALGSALAIPGVAALSAAESRPYGVADALLDITFGTALGAGLHAGIGAYTDWRARGTPMPTIARVLEDLPLQDRATILRGAVANVAEGRPVNVAPLVDEAVQAWALREMRRLQAAQERLDVEEGRILRAAERAEKEDDLNARIAELEEETARLRREAGEARERAQPDTATTERLEAIDRELAGTLPAARRLRLMAERRLVEEGVAGDPALDALRAEVEARGLDIAAGRREQELGRLRGRQKRRQESAALAAAEFRRASGRAASRRNVVQAMAERVVRQAAGRLGVRIEGAQAAEMARRILASGGDRAVIRAEMESLAGLPRDERVPLRPAAEDRQLGGDSIDAFKRELLAGTVRFPDPRTGAPPTNPTAFESVLARAWKVDPEAVAELQAAIEALQAPMAAIRTGQARAGLLRRNRAVAREDLEALDDLLERILPQRAERGTELMPHSELWKKRNPIDAAFGRAPAKGLFLGGVMFSEQDLPVVKIASDAPFENKKAWLQHVARHETIHALKRYGFFSPEEWKVLETAARENAWHTKIGIESVKGATNSGLKIEESIAEAFALWADGKLADDLPAKWRGEIEQVFGRIAEFLIRLKQALLGEGLTDWEKIFARVESGEIGARTPTGLDAASGTLRGKGPAHAEFASPQARFDAALDRVIEAAAKSYGMDVKTQIARESLIQARAQTPFTVGEQVIWRNADTDLPVTFLGIEGAAPDGRVYARVRYRGQDQDSFVPLDELVAGMGAAERIARDNLEPWRDPADAATAERVREAAAARPAVRARAPEEGIGEATPDLRELEELDAATQADLQAATTLEPLTAAEQAALDEADAALAQAKDLGRARDLGAICLTGAGA